MPRRPGRAKSCTACRQVKQACDARHKAAGASCTRCTKRGLLCRFDSNFKRIPTRNIVEAITNNIDPQQPAPCASSWPNMEAESRREQTTKSQEPNIPSSASTCSPSPASPTDSQPSTVHIGDTTTSATATLEGCIKAREAWLKLKAVDIPCSYRLGSLVVNNTVALELFQHFDVYYYPHCKFLRPIRTSLSDYSQSSPHLFWTIILCSSQMHEKHAHMYPAIVTEHENMLSGACMHWPLSTEVIHSLLCLCLWPIPKLRLWQDPSWGYIGLAVNAAMQLNCHLPPNSLFHAQLRRNASRRAMPVMDAAVRDTTWLACFDISTRLGELLGFPSTLSSRYHLDYVSRAQERASSLLDPSYQTLLKIRLLTATWTTHLDMITDSGIHFSQTKNSVADLERLRVSEQQYWSPEVELNLQGAKLHLYALTLLLPTPEEPTEASQVVSNRDTVLRSGLMSASALISEMLCRSREKIALSSETSICSIAFWPKTHMTYLFFASTFIFRVLLSHSDLSGQDRTLAMSCLADAHIIFKMEPSHPDRTRAALIIQRLIEINRAYKMEDESQNSLESLPPRDLLVTGRLGASIQFDAVLRSVHYRRQKAQRHKTCSSNDISADPASASASGCELQVADQTSSELIEYWRSVGALADLSGPGMDGNEAPGLNDAFNPGFVDPYDYMMVTDPGLLLDSLENRGFGIWN
ncbi:putative transcription factor SEF1 [Fusarium austroafricanum]|uniref:Putative transcription factor SEF1 n=1 Tax=Fusarium austroafricanum TaxID=2364996 RepID=A0A8H4KEV2_9HYPO|nr:putative transcription factor SEF1 [Fusarium austroafricanum]